MNKKALSPLVATIILVVFALAIGTITMNWGKSYVETLDIEEKTTKGVIIEPYEIDTALKELQIKHLIGEISQEEYLERQKELI